MVGDGGGREDVDESAEDGRDGDREPYVAHLPSAAGYSLHR